VQDLFEPELICLMHCYEQQFIMMRRARQAILEVDQILNAKVFVVRKRRILAVVL
jgi:hypothetical protein